MKLRKLEEKDACFMLEWMHDSSIVEMFCTNFLDNTIEDCMEFIEESSSNRNCLHMAVVDEEDTYMGTVSLKNKIEGTAEFAIVVRKAAMGKGYAAYAMNEILKIGFEQIKLKKIYWYVAKENRRAIRFYEKNNYKRVKFPPVKIENIGIKKYHEFYLWYAVEKNSFFDHK